MINKMKHIILLTQKRKEIYYKVTKKKTLGVCHLNINGKWDCPFLKPALKVKPISEKSPWALCSVRLKLIYIGT